MFRSAQVSFCSGQWGLCRRTSQFSVDHICPAIHLNGTQNRPAFTKLQSHLCPRILAQGKQTFDWALFAALLHPWPPAALALKDCKTQPPTLRSPEMLAPARIPVAEGKKMENMPKKLPDSPRQSGTMFCKKMSPSGRKRERKGMGDRALTQPQGNS